MEPKPYETIDEDVSIGFGLPKSQRAQLIALALKAGHTMRNGRANLSSYMRHVVIEHLKQQETPCPPQTPTV